MKLLNALNTMKICVAKQDVRYYLNALCIDFNDDGTINRLVSTNGGELLELTLITAPSTDRLLVEKSGISKLGAMLGDRCINELTKNDIMQYLIDDDICKGNYPDIDRVINGSHIADYGDVFEIGFNVTYLANIHKINNAIIKGVKMLPTEKTFAKAWKFTFKSNTDPVVATKTYKYTDNTVDVKYILMPCRL